MEAGKLGAMQVALRRRAGLALASIWLLLSSVLALQHVAAVAHVVDRTTGRVQHADRLIGRHVGGSDIHRGSSTHHADDECTIAASLGQAARAPVADSCVAAPPVLAIDAVVHREPRARQLIYRFAPKTSPPAAARTHV